MQDLAERGLAILMISSELPEILGMSDRIAVMRRGTIAGVLSRAEATADTISLAMALDPESMTRHRRELSVAIAIAALAVVLAVAAPGYFSGENLNDLFLANLPVLVVALGMTLVVLDRRDRHLGRVAVRALQRRRRRAGEGGLADARVVASARALIGAMSRRGQRRARRLRAHPVHRRDARGDGRAARRTALDDRRRVGAGPAGRASNGSGSVSRRILLRRGRLSWPVLFVAIGWGLRHLSAGRAIYATGSNPRRGAARRTSTSRRDQMSGVRGGRRADGARRRAQRRPLQSDSEQRRHRSRDEGHRRRRRRRRRHSRRPRQRRRHAPRRRPARRDRSGAHVPRRERLLGTRAFRARSSSRPSCSMPRGRSRYAAWRRRNAASRQSRRPDSDVTGGSGCFRTANGCCFWRSSSRSRYFRRSRATSRPLGNFFEVLRLSVELGLLAMALTPVIISGGHRSVGRIDGRARGGGVWRGRAGLAPAGRRGRAGRACSLALAGGALNGLLIARFDIPPLIVTLGTFSLFRGIAEGMTHAAVNYTGFPAGFPRARSGLPGGHHPGPASAFPARARRLTRPPAPVGHRPCHLRDRLQRRRGAIRRPARAAAPRSRLRAVGPRGEPRGDRLRRPSRSGPLGRGHGLRARRDCCGRARRHVGLRRPRYALGHAARPSLALGAAQRRAARGASIRAHRRLDGRPAGDDDCHRPLARSRRRRAAAIFGGPRREEQPSGHALRRDHRRRNRRGRHQRLARAIAAVRRAGRNRGPVVRRRIDAGAWRQAVWSSR